MGNICYIDTNFSTGEFESIIQYIKEQGISEGELKDKKLEGVLVTDQKVSPYTQDDFIDAVSKLKNNFCDERIEDVKKIGKDLYPEINKKVESHHSNKKIVIALVVIVIIILLFLFFMKNKQWNIHRALQ